MKILAGHLADLPGIVLVCMFICVALAAPWLAPESNILPRYAPGEPYRSRLSFKIGGMPQPPGVKAILGTNSRQDDVYYTLVWDTRNMLVYSLIVVLVSASLGIVIGLTSGYAGGRTSRITMDVTNGFMAVPLITIFVIIDLVKRITWKRLVGADYPPNPYADVQASSMMTFFFSFDSLMLALLLTNWIPYARLLNVLVTQVKSREFIEAARCIGVKDGRIIYRHILPNILPPVLVLAGRDIGAIVLLQASLTFAGFGGISAWGSLLRHGMSWILSGTSFFSFWWVWLPATLMIMLYGVSWNLLAETVNRRFDPRRFGRI
jgi:peptide/nickel transport system permease protein